MQVIYCMHLSCSLLLVRERLVVCRYVCVYGVSLCVRALLCAALLLRAETVLCVDALCCIDTLLRVNITIFRVMTTTDAVCPIWVQMIDIL
jgi:hypothetical protein